MKNEFMKTTGLSILTAIAILVFPLSSNGQETTVKSIRMKLSQNRAIEVAFSTIKVGKEKQFLQEYFPKIMPIVTEYDGYMLTSFSNKTLSGDIQAQNVVFFDWPSAGVFIKILTDPRVSELMKIRNEALDFINEANFFQILNTKEVVLSSDKIYTLIADKKDTIFEIEKILTSYQGKTIASLLSDENNPGEFNPKQLLIVEWDKDIQLNLYLDFIKSKKDEIYVFKLQPRYI
jgi:uncharacterized protein (DUF1330 family)